MSIENVVNTLESSTSTLATEVTGILNDAVNDIEGLL